MYPQDILYYIEKVVCANWCNSDHRSVDASCDDRRRPMRRPASTDATTHATTHATLEGLSEWSEVRRSGSGWAVGSLYIRPLSAFYGIQFNGIRF